MSLPTLKVRVLKLKSLLAIVQNAIREENYLFRNLYAQVEEMGEVDILEDGRNSCAVFVSWILLALEMIKKPHASVDSTERDLIASGWFEIDDPKPGAVIVYGATDEVQPFLGIKGVEHRHMGFYIGNDEVISNSSNNGRVPTKHHYTYGTNADGSPKRKVEKIYWHHDLD